jgi:hypothetical protein
MVPFTKRCGPELELVNRVVMFVTPDKRKRHAKRHCSVKS